MKFTIYFIGLLLTFLLLSCQNEQAQTEESGTEKITSETQAGQPASTVDQLLAKTVEAHGGKLYETAHYSFMFRKKAYTFKNTGGEFIYTVTGNKEGITTVDILKNNRLIRTVDGQKVVLNEKQYASAIEDLNSVIYFATLPHKLLDPAVNLEKLAPITIKNKDYDVLKVNFDEAGGGTDHDDNFRYWINQKTGRIDYLAYDYRTNGGGVRFRSAYNTRIVDRILFQDYVNYKAEVGTNLDELPGLYERGQLKELSRIDTENVTALP